MDGCNLKVFNGGVIWIDGNQNVNYQIQLFTFLFGKHFYFAPNVKEASEIAKKHEKQNFILMTNSKLIEDIKKQFKSVVNTFHKYLIFCGTSVKAKQCEQKYPESVFKATTEIAAASDIIHCEDERQLAKQKKNTLKDRIVWVYHDDLSETYGKVHLKKFRWNFSVIIELMDVDECVNQMEEDQSQKFILISNGKTKLHEYLEDKNIEKWIKYSFIPDSASPKKKYNKKSESESDEDEDDENELQDKEDINYKGIEYARNQLELAEKLGVEIQKQKKQQE